MKFRKKPVIIEAVQWNGRSLELLWDLDPERKQPFTIDGSGGCMIHTSEGVMRADPTDWIIKGVKGEFYPCKADIFEATYERVSEEAV